MYHDIALTNADCFDIIMHSNDFDSALCPGQTSSTFPNTLSLCSTQAHHPRTQIPHIEK